MPDPSTLHEVLNVPSANIDATTKLLTLLLNVLVSNPMVGAVVAIAAGVSTYFVKHNTLVTKENTAQSEANSKQLEKMDAILKASEARMAAHAESIKADLAETVRQTKVFQIKSFNQINQELSRIPSVQRALEKRMNDMETENAKTAKVANTNHEDLAKFINGLEKIKERKE